MVENQISDTDLKLDLNKMNSDKKEIWQRINIYMCVIYTYICIHMYRYIIVNKRWLIKRVTSVPR